VLVSHGKLGHPGHGINIYNDILSAKNGLTLPLQNELYLPLPSFNANSMVYLPDSASDPDPTV
jgi:hypothetical protein